MRVKMNRSAVLAIASNVAFCAVSLGAELPPEIRFAADGTVAAFDSGNGSNMIDAAHPGNGFVVNTFTGNAIEETRLENVQRRGDVLLVSGEKGWPRLTFDVARQGHYLALKLNRVEGLPAASLASLLFEMHCSCPNVHVLSLDYMTKAGQHGTSIKVEFNYLWHRKAGDPLGGFALYVAGSDAEEDEALIDIWCGEDLPKPAIGEPWTKDRARRWIDDYYEQFRDMTTMILSAQSEEDLYQLTTVAQQHGIKMIYLHTDTWRGEYWPVEHSHVHVNQKVFPKGRPDLRRYSEHLLNHGMHLALHYVCGGIGPKDPHRIAGHVDRNLAAWCHGQLAGPIDEKSPEIRFQPAPGCEFPFVSGIHPNSPGVYEHIFEPRFLRIEEEIVRVGEFADLDKPVWTLLHCQRAHGATAAASHPAGADAAGLLSAYGQNFVPDTDSLLLEEMAREYAEFANDIHLGQLEYDGYEIHGQYPWGSRKFSDLVARRLDHAVVSNTSSGRPVDANLEMRFSKIRAINQFGYHTVNLSFQLDDHRVATSILDAWFELSSLVAKGVRRFQILKPEPMFGVSREILATHGLVDEMFGAFDLWREVLPRMSDDQLLAMRRTLTPFGNHMRGKDLFQVRKLADHYEVIPTRVMLRKQADVDWLVGQEFGPVGPRQVCQPGQPLELENPFDAQPATFVIRVLAEDGENIPGKAVATTAGPGNAILDSYRTGADGAGKAMDTAADPAAVSTVNVIQPRATDIRNQRFAQFAQEGDTLVMTAENPRGEPARIEEDLPSWGRQFSMVTGRGIAMDIEGDGSGAVVLLQLHGRGTRDYIVKIDFTGRRTVYIPHGEASWADGNWGWRFGAKNFDYHEVHQVGLGFGFIPPRTNPRVRIARLRVLADVPSRLVNPVIRAGNGKMTVHGEIETGCYLRYDGGDVATVHDRNWKKLRTLEVSRENYIMPSGFATVRVDVGEGAPRPWLELQTLVTGKPMVVRIRN
jgi:hypothetical protein